MNRDFRAAPSHPYFAAAFAAGALLLTLALMLVASSSALAATAHPLVRTFSTGVASWPNAIATDGAGNVYVMQGNGNGNGLLKFDANGNPVPFSGSAPYITGNKLTGNTKGSFGTPAGYVFGLAVDSSGGSDNGYIYVTNIYGEAEAGISVFAPTGLFKGLMDPGARCGVAVNQANGSVYTGEYFNEHTTKIRRFAAPVGDPSDDQPNAILSVTEANGCPLAVDNLGNAFVSGNDWVGTAKNGLLKFSAAQFGSATPTSTALSPFPDPGNALVLDSASGYYVDLGTQIVRHNAAGAQVGSPFPSGPLRESRGIAIGASSNIYVTEEGGEGDGGVSVFGPAEVNLPVVTTQAPSNVIQVAAHANGEVDPDGAGNVTKCEFVYGRDLGYTEGSVPCTQALPITTKTAVSADITGLNPQSHYHFRLVAGNANGAQPGGDQAFDTLPPVQDVTTNPATQITSESANLNGSFTGNGESTQYYFEYGPTESYGSKVPAAPASAGSPTGQTDVAPIALNGLQGSVEYHFRLVATNKYGTSRGGDQAFTTPASVAGLTTDPPTAVTNTTVLLNGSFDADGRETRYYFEWGETQTYGNKTPAPPGNVAPGTGRVKVPPVELTGLGGGLTYHYRIVASNSAGATVGQDQVVKTAEAPIIGNLNTTKLQATSVELLGEINPRFGDTTYQFEWGTTNKYGNVTPGGNAGSGNAPVKVSSALQGLTEGITYHFRLVATNQYGTTVSADQTFGFYPPNCPNAQLRQETRSNTLPDCRAYELVTPSFANGALVMTRGGTGVPYNATSPSRISYSTFTNLFPEESGQATNQVNDPYVSTRTDTGWTQRYVGLPPSQTGSMAGPPSYFLVPLLYIDVGFAEFSDGSQASPNLDRFLNYSYGLPVDNFTGLYSKLPNGVEGLSNSTRGQPSNAPYVWDSTTGQQLAHWPTNLNEMGLKGLQFVGMPEASNDFSHLVFMSDTPYATEGPNGPDEDRDLICCSGGGYPVFYPGPIYDNDIAARTVKLASLKHDESQFKGYIIHTSDNGTRILMSEEWTNPYASVNRQTFPHGYRSNRTELKGPMYLRVNGTETLEFLNGRHFNYVGSTADGKTVYVRSSEKLTADDHDNSADLFVWHEESPNTLTRLSIGNFGNAGNDDECGGATWSGGGCSIEVTDFRAYAGVSGAGLGGNATSLSDQTIASNAGDIYFLSPERLVAGKGDAGEANLYVSHDGTVKYVATMKGQATCSTISNFSGGCASGPVARMEITPDGAHMAFITAWNVTGYDSAGHTEMYRYDLSTERVFCVSCRPDGKPPVGETLGSQNGRFMTDDGRAFFVKTLDSLVPKDTDGVEDAYEYTEGRAQLITSGLGTVSQAIYDGYGSTFVAGGFIGVSANGIDAYFGTTDTLTSQDHNGSRYKIYDARVGGGFPAERTPPNCEAADECHGPSSNPPTLPPDRTSANFGSPKKQAAKKTKKHKKKKHKKKATNKKKRAAKSTSKKRRHNG